MTNFITLHKRISLKTMRLARIFWEGGRAAVKSRKLLE